jgi:hypothetical protein
VLVNQIMPTRSPSIGSITEWLLCTPTHCWLRLHYLVFGGSVKMEDFLPHTRVFTACVLGTLYFVQKAFMVDRPFVPSQSLFMESIVVPTPLRVRWFWSCCAICVWTFVFPSAWCVFAIHCWCLITLSADRYIWSPHLIHFTIAAAVLSLDTSRAFLDVFAVCVYTFAGLQKFNFRFIDGFVSNVIAPVVRRHTGRSLNKILPQWTQRLMGFGAALTECLLGLLLLHSWRWYWLIAALHAVILICFGPIGRNQFHGIFAWNVYCLYLAITGALYNTHNGLYEWLVVGRPINLWLLIPFVCVFTILPAASLIARFGERISFKMHSENSLEFEFIIEKNANTVIPAALVNYTVVRETDENTLDVQLQDYALRNAYLMTSLSTRTACSLGRILEAHLGVPVKVARVLDE